MAGLEALASTIYHEKQQEGSMLCAQHALNSLLQGNYFTAPDLSDIARSLDTLEESYDNERGQTSTNMDDTGFFSVQVLENALTVWGLNLVRWRSEAMRAYQDRPHTQLGFILNLEQHWFTLRRFGPAVSNLDSDPGDGHWFNLNSFHKSPEWVGKLYLGMVLQQAEAEGYSVFAVTQADPEGPLALPRVLADEVAATLPEPTSAATSSNPSFQGTMSSESGVQPDGALPPLDSENFGDEDWELQAAIQASLMDGEDTGSGQATPSGPPPLSRGTVPLPDPIAQPISAFGGPLHNWESNEARDDDEDGEIDPVAQSMERSRLYLQRTLAEQQHALREQWDESDLTPEEAQALQERRERRRREAEEEEEQMRKAIEESERLANEHRSKRARLSDSDGQDNDQDGDVDMDQRQSPPLGGLGQHNAPRVYDDEDAELQAALKASLESVPAGWQEPEPLQAPPQVRHHVSEPIETKDREDNASLSSSTTDSADREPTPEPLDLAEIRRRRLAKFGS